MSAALAPGMLCAALDATTHDQIARVSRDHRAYLRGFARHLCRGDADADDLVQDALVAALRRGHALPSDGDLRAWLTAVIRHRHVDRCRRQATRRKAQRALATHPIAPTDPAPWWTDLDADAVRAQLHTLPPELARPFDLFAFERASYKDIARRLGIPTATVGTRILRARARLRAILTPAAIASPGR